MSNVLALMKEAKRTGDYQLLMNAVPYARFLGLSVTVENGELLSTLAYKDDLIGNPAIPALHGGTIGALLESAAVFELLWASETIVIPKMITFTVDYLRSAGPATTYAKGIITKHGRRVVTVRTAAWQDDRNRPVATANAHLLITPPEGEAGESQP